MTCCTLDVTLMSSTVLQPLYHNTTTSIIIIIISSSSSSSSSSKHTHFYMPDALLMANHPHQGTAVQYFHQIITSIERLWTTQA